MTHLYTEIASSVDSRCNCIAQDLAQRWIDSHENRARGLVKDHMPSGAGIDLDASTGECLVFTVPYEHGSDEWVTFTVSVTASLLHRLTLELETDVHDPDSEPTTDLEDYVHDVMREALETEL